MDISVVYASFSEHESLNIDSVLVCGCITSRHKIILLSPPFRLHAVLLRSHIPNGTGAVLLCMYIRGKVKKTKLCLMPCVDTYAYGAASTQVGYRHCEITIIRKL